MIVFGFVFSMLCFLGIGMASAYKSQKEVADYLIAGRSISPVAAGLSAVASNNSGFMFIGAIGFTYTYGLSAFWLLFAWIVGDYLSWLIVHRKLRAQSEQLQSTSVVGFLAHDGKNNHRQLQIILGVLTVIFLTLYAAAQLKAGGKALEAMLNWDQTMGIYIGMAMVALYSFSGGIRASIWTDIAQSLVMVGAMALLVGVCHYQVVDISSLLSKLESIDPKLLHWTPSDAQLGLAPYALGWFLAGFGGIGQPHIIIRAMTLQSPDDVPTMRRTYFSWYIIFSIFTFLVGLYARVYFNAQPDLNFDKETALPLLAAAQLMPFLVGVILAALFAATMSTADSLVLASSASITQDIPSTPKNKLLYSKTATILVVITAGIAALFGPDSVFTLVTIAWGLMMSCFAPLMIARVCSWQISWQKLLVSIGMGLIAMFTWRSGLSLGDSVYEGAVGFAVAMLCVWMMRENSSLKSLSS